MFSFNCPRVTNNFALFVASLGLVGCIRPLSGTWGTLVTLPFAFMLAHLGVYFLIIAIIITLGLGLWSSSKVISSKNQDPHFIVIDEALGIMIAFIPLSFGYLSSINVILAFLLFRLFDGLKPFPINYLEKSLSGSIGIMIDDLIAGVFSGVCLLIIIVIYRSVLP